MEAYRIQREMNSLFEILVQSQNYWDKEKGKTVGTFTNKEGIYFKAVVKSEFLGYEKDGNTFHSDWYGFDKAYYHVIMLYPHCVFVCISDNNDMPQTGWENTSNHDSCWRDGCSSLVSVVFDCHEKAHKNIPEEEKKKLILTDHTSIDLTKLLTKMFQFVSVDWEYEEDGYHKIIKNVKVIKKTVTC